MCPKAKALFFCVWSAQDQKPMHTTIPGLHKTRQGHTAGHPLCRHHTAGSTIVDRVLSNRWLPAGSRGSKECSKAVKKSLRFAETRRALDRADPCCGLLPPPWLILSYAMHIAYSIAIGYRPNSSAACGGSSFQVIVNSSSLPRTAWHDVGRVSASSLSFLQPGIYTVDTCPHSLHGGRYHISNVHVFQYLCLPVGRQRAGAVGISVTCSLYTRGASHSNMERQWHLGEEVRKRGCVD